MAAAKQRNSREENERNKAGETREKWTDNPARLRQKDTDARWTKKRGQSHYGYKNHINVDRRHKPVRRYHVSDASVHDSQVLNEILDHDYTALGVWADSAYDLLGLSGPPVMRDPGGLKRLGTVGHVWG